MITLITIIHIVIAAFLIFFVLIQDSKGAMGGVFGGGGSQTVFGSSGGGNMLTKITRLLAISFAVTCLVLSYMSAHKNDSVMEGFNAPNPALNQPAPKAEVPAQPTQPAETANPQPTSNNK